MNKKHIFISYNRTDIGLMRKIRQSLLANYRLPVWTDEGIPPDTANWLKSIQTAITQAHCLICVLTPNTPKSDWVMEELFYARTKGVSIYMLLLDGDIESSTIFGFSMVQVTDMTDPDVYEERFNNLAETIRSKHIEMSDNTAEFSPRTLDKVNAMFREHEEEQKIEIPENEFHIIQVRKGAGSTLQSRYKIEQNPCIVGRDETKSSIVIRDRHVSRKHCDFLYTEEGMFIRDLGSSNGTYIDGERIEDKFLLKDGNRITFARPELRRVVELVYFCKKEHPVS